MRPSRPAVLVSVGVFIILSIGAVILSMCFSLYHFPPTESSAALSLGGAFMSLVFLGPAIEWYLPPRTVGKSKLGIIALFSTGLVIVPVGYWVALAVLSISNPISPSQYFYDGLYLTMIEMYGLVVTEMIKGAKAKRA